MPRVIHFEIVTDDPERTQQFYEAVFDWKVEKWNGPMDYWFLMTGESDEPGIDGAFGLRQSQDDHVINTIDVDDIDKYVDLIKENGGEIIRPRSTIPGVGYLAYFKDSEGNLWGLMQDDSSAK
ncbi:MAG: VOC family protein [Candidatus Thorarchaeota archaeon]|nr:VOC family protein [Candidatus Thorarchaeota archaeon]